MQTHTTRLYQTDPYRTETRARVTAVTERNGQTLLCLDQTLFFPTGGGQPCDTGRIAGLPVCEVYERDGEIFHVLDSDGAAQGGDGTQTVDAASAAEQDSRILSIGDEVVISIDWDRRFDHMQRHCGEHILSGAFHRLYGGINRGFHMGQEEMTIDIALEDPNGPQKITPEMAEAAEREANAVIWADLPIDTLFFARRADVPDDLPLRKPLAFDRDISVVRVGAPEDPADCVACCGTHPRHSGQVGLIKIYRLESNKGMTRIYFEAGQRAFRLYQGQFRTLQQLGNQLSAGPHDLLDKFAARQEKARQTRDALYHLTQWVVDREVDDIRQHMAPALVRQYDHLTVEDLLSIGRALAGEIPTVLFLVHRPTRTVLLFTDRLDAGKLVRENASIYQGKGGGNQTSARAIFPKAEYPDLFIDLIEKHLR